MHEHSRPSKRRIRGVGLLLGLTLGFMVSSAEAQLATSHWIPPQLSLLTGTQHLFISTPTVTPVNVTVTDGTGASVFTGQVSNAAPQQVVLGTQNLLTDITQVNQMTTAGLLVTADEPVYANIRHLVGAQGTSLTAKGFSALGTRFRAGVLREEGIFSQYYRGAFISVMAVEDGTTVSFDEFKTGVVFFGTATPTTLPFSVALDANESYVIGVRADVYAGTAQFDDITGTLVTANKPIAAVSGSWLGGPNFTGAQDIGIDQLIPESIAGSDYVLIRGNAPTTSVLESPTVVATVDGTTVTVNGDPTVVCTLDAGDYCYLDNQWGSSGENMLVQASEPVLVHQMIGGSASEATPGLNVIPPILAAGNGTLVVDNIPHIEFVGAATLGIIAKAGATVSINGAAVGAPAVPVDGDPSFVTYRVAGLTGDIKLESSDVVAAAVYNVNGAIGAAGYFSGFPPSVEAGPCDASEVTLFDWTVEDIGGSGQSNWVVAPDGLTVDQLLNGLPTVFYGPFEVSATTISGTAHVTSSADDDYFGFVLGFEPGDSSNGAADYLVVDWKQNSQFFDHPGPGAGTTGVRGLALSRVSGVATADELWGHVTQPNTPGGVVELARGANLGNVGWVDPPPVGSYEFTFEYTATNIKVFVDGFLEIDYTTPTGVNLPTGRIGFYNFSQNNSRYSAFSQQSVPSVTPPPPLELTCRIGGIPVTDPAIVAWLAQATVTGGVDPVNLVNDAPQLFVNGCPSVTTVTFTASDLCQNLDSATSTVTLVDIDGPAVDPLAPISVSCIEDVPLPNIGIVTFTDCNAAVVTHVSDLSDGATCPETINRTYRVTDSCGNFTSVTQVITVDDDTPPVVDPLDGTVVQCIEDVPLPDIGIVSYTDNCSVAGVVIHVGDVSDGQSCPRTITRTYRVADGCGNTTDVTQTITVDDDTPPTVDPIADAVVECVEDVPLPDIGIVSYTDNCLAAGTVTHVGDVSDGQSCPQTITRTYRVADGCGNTTDVTQTITVDDDEGPVVQPLAGVSVECDEDVPVADPDTVIFTDNCLAASSVSHVGDVSDGLSCPRTVTRTYRVTDGCGNTSDVAQVITVDDVTAPVVQPLAAVAVECVEDVPAANIGIVSYTDNCLAASVVTHVGDLSDGQSCPETITRTYRVTDGCGNATDVTQMIVVDDVTPPVVQPLTAVAIECIEDVPAPDTTLVLYTDNCLAASAVSYVADVSDGQSCPETITRTYRVTDGCGNATDVTQVIIVDDVTAPVIDPLPDVAVQCIEDVPAADPATVTYSDNCLAASAVTHVGDVSDGQSCPETVVRTYRVTDGCGNTAEVTQTIVVDDDTPPVVDPLPVIEVSCAEDVPAADTGQVTFSDNCLAATTVSHVGDANDGLFCPTTVTRTYRVTDGCGNATDVTQSIIVNDLTPPVIAGVPADEEVECDAVPDPAEPTVSDNCLIAPTLDYLQEHEDGECEDDYVLTRTWTATDGCGNVTVEEQVITVVDTTSPMVTALLEPTMPIPPSSAASACSPASHREFRIVCEASDNCDDMPTLTATLMAAQSVAGPNSTCTTVVEEIDVDCDQLVDIVLLATPCAVSAPSSAHPATGVNSDGVLVVFAESVILEVTAEDRCGNVAGDTFDPAADPSTLCDEVLDDGTCCPAIGQPPSDCDGDACGAGGFTGADADRRAAREPPVVGLPVSEVNGSSR